MKLLNVDKFIELTKKEPLKWITYCEVIITPTGLIGNVEQGRCHVGACMDYVISHNKITEEEIKNDTNKYECLPIEWMVDKYGLIAVWYNGYMYHHKGPNRLQKITLDKLEKAGLINPTYNSPATAYLDYTNLIKKGINK